MGREWTPKMSAIPHWSLLGKFAANPSKEISPELRAMCLLSPAGPPDKSLLSGLPFRRPTVSLKLLSVWEHSTLTRWKKNYFSLSPFPVMSQAEEVKSLCLPELLKATPWVHSGRARLACKMKHKSQDGAIARRRGKYLSDVGVCCPYITVTEQCLKAPEIMIDLVVCLCK